jgi:hypothetical protein
LFILISCCIICIKSKMSCDESSIEALEYGILICNLISMVFCFAIIIICLSSDLFEKFTRIILLNMAISDFLRSLFMALAFWIPDSRLCQFSGYIINYTFQVITVWALFICITLSKQIHDHRYNYAKHLKIWTIFVYLILPIIDLLPLFTNSYGYADSFCSLELDIYGNIWRFSLIYVPSLLLFH